VRALPGPDRRALKHPRGFVATVRAGCYNGPPVQLSELDRLLRDLLSLDALAAADRSLNGLQVANSRGVVERMAFAVDACLESFRRAASWKADLLFVHHGLFWGQPLALTGTHYRRIRALLEADLALYAVHLPLDLHAEVGNNAGLARSLGLQELEPFGEYHGIKIGCKGCFPEERSLEEVVRLCGGGSSGGGPKVLPFGPQRVRRVGVVSGGAAEEALQAIEEELDLFITGEASHSIYHYCLEAGIDVIFGGHYLTETWGVRLLCEKLARETGLETSFLDIPTGL
jgi:dinuclear metal center YbgI/SA1388 family protein